MGSNQGGESRRRHCMVVHAYYPETETRVEREAMALLDHGIKVDVICLRGSNELGLETVDGIQVHRLPVRRHRGSGALVQLLEYLAFFVLAFFRLTGLYLQQHYDIVQVHNLPDFLVFVALIPRLTGAKVILDLHDLMPEFYAERFQRPLDSLPVLLVRWQERLSCLFADHVVTVTELWRQALIERRQPPEKVTVVMNVADDRVFRLDAEKNGPGDHDGVQDQVGDDDRFRLIYHGIIGKHHDLDLALRAVDLVRQTAPDVHLTLHGGGEYLGTLIQLVDELGLQDHVEFSTVFLPTTELPKLLRRANLAIVPYRNGVFTGGILPTKLMEYAALGIPAIAARTPAIAAYFDETAVQFFTPGDVDELAHCILTLYHDRARLANLARNITRFSERYNWHDQRAVYLQLVDRLAGQRDRSQEAADSS